MGNPTKITASAVQPRDRERGQTINHAAAAEAYPFWAFWGYFTPFCIVFGAFRHLHIYIVGDKGTCTIPT